MVIHSFSVILVYVFFFFEESLCIFLYATDQLIMEWNWSLKISSNKKLKASSTIRFQLSRGGDNETESLCRDPATLTREHRQIHVRDDDETTNEYKRIYSLGSAK